MATNFLSTLPELIIVEKNKKIINENDFLTGFILTDNPKGLLFYNPLSEAYEFHDNSGGCDNLFNEYDGLIDFIKENFPDIKMYKYE
jgi:hypothetical protein